MWDNWLFQEDKYYLFFLMGTQEGPWNAFGLATSDDAVHWKYHGPILHQKHEASWMGTGYTWRGPCPESEKRYLINFSEWHQIPGSKGQQAIFFGESKDLVHWEHLPDDLEFTPDPRYYRLDEGGMSRWDTIHEVPRDEGGYYGFLTANPQGFLHGTGFCESSDGIHWRSLPPPEFKWTCPEHLHLMPQDRGLEIGGIARLAGRYFMLIGDVAFGMATMWAETPEGPWYSAAKNFNIFPHPKRSWIGNPTYYSRFFFGKDGNVYINQHAIARYPECPEQKHPVYTTPLKKAVVDNDGTLRAAWWDGNEKLKNEPAGPRVQAPVQMGELQVMRIDASLDASGGFVVEGTFETGDMGNGRCGLLVEMDSPGNMGVLHQSLLFGADGTLEIGVYDLSEGEVTLDVEDEIDHEKKLDSKNRFRFLLRRGMMELYVNDLLACHWSAPFRPTGNIGWAARGCNVTATGLEAWSMNI